MKNKEHSRLAKQLKVLQSRQYGYQIQVEQLKKDISWYILQNLDDLYGFYYTEYRENLGTLDDLRYQINKDSKDIKDIKKRIKYIQKYVSYETLDWKM